MTSPPVCSVSREAVPLPMAISADIVLRQQLAQQTLRFVRLMQGYMVSDSRWLAVLIHHGHLAAGAKAGVNAQHLRPRSGGCKSKLRRLVSENIDGVFFGAPGQFDAHLAFQRWREQALIAVFHCVGEVVGKGR